METFAAKAKEPFKTTLAMVIAYAIGLSMDWDKVFRAAFAVAFGAMARGAVLNAPFSPGHALNLQPLNPA